MQDVLSRGHNASSMKCRFWLRMAGLTSSLVYAHMLLLRKTTMLASTFIDHGGGAAATFEVISYYSKRTQLLQREGSSISRPRPSFKVLYTHFVAIT